MAYTGIDLTDEELQLLLSSKNYKESDYTKVGTSNNLAHNIGNILNERTCFGFTTGGHTGEEVLLAAYHPQGDVPRGNMRNTGLNQYLQEVSGLEYSLQELSDRIFMKHVDVFKGMSYSINRNNPDFPVLMVKKGKTRMEIPAFSSVVKKNGNSFDIGSVVVYIDKNDTFYLPANLREMF
jgi:alkaline phosphatase